MLNWIVNDKQIEPHIPVWEKSQRDDGTFSRSDFRFDNQGNTYECPGGKQLTTTGLPTSEDTVLFRAKNEDCADCAYKQRCCPNTPNRQDRAQHLRRRAQRRTYCMRDTGLREVAQGPKEGGDAVCPPQTHQEARPAATAGPQWRARRVPDGRGGAEPSKNGQVADPEVGKEKPRACMK